MTRRLETMLSQSTARALQSEFLPKETKMHRIVSGEAAQQPPPSRRQCHSAPIEIPSCGGLGAALSRAPIPLPSSHIHRTKSELQLDEDMHAAEFRDRCMFQRLVTGIQSRQAVLETQKAKVAQLQALSSGSSLRRRSKLRLSFNGSSSAVAPAPMLSQPDPQFQLPALPTANEHEEFAATVSPYQSMTTSPAQPGPAVDRRQHLQDVLYMASGLADESLLESTTTSTSDTNQSNDWSLGGYESQAPLPLMPQLPQPAAQHQSYFMGPPPAAVEQDEIQVGLVSFPEHEEEDDDDDMADGEIFSLDM